MKLPHWRVLNLTPGQLRPIGKICAEVFLQNTLQKLSLETLFWEEEEVLWGKVSSDPGYNLVRMGAVRLESDGHKRYFAET